MLKELHFGDSDLKKDNHVPLVIVTFVPCSCGKILQRDHLHLTKHMWYNQGCILTSSFGVLSHNIGLYFGHWKKKLTIQILLFFFFSFSVSSDIESFAMIAKYNFLFLYTWWCLLLPTSARFQLLEKWEDANTAPAWIPGSLSVKAHFHFNDRNASNSYIKRK